ncbi:hypothetical protein FOS03_23670 [Bacillus paranthracis]|nr:hypothetical protein BACI_c30620 [Bacillus cereus biovar anthracis str. CI]MDR4323588.1 hypothetical protein [Bacillus paranthracis]
MRDFRKELVGITKNNNLVLELRGRHCNLYKLQTINMDCKVVVSIIFWRVYDLIKVLYEYYNVELYNKYITKVDRKSLHVMTAFYNKRMFKFGDVMEVN